MNLFNKSQYENLIKKESEIWGASKSGQRMCWFDSPLLYQYVNMWISGRPDVDWLDYTRNNYLPSPATLGLNVGCGHGELERIILRRDIVETMHGLDISPNAIEQATKKANEESLDGRVRYVVGDANYLEKSDLDEEYDIVFGAMALHHFPHIEQCLDSVKKILKPGGLFVVNEFVGPDRFQWSDDQLDAVNQILACFPWDLKKNLREEGKTKLWVDRPSLRYMKNELAFEAICSERIIPAIYDRFEVLDHKPYGGTLLHLIFEAIMGNFDEDGSREHAVILRMVCACERLLLQHNAIEHDHALLVCRNNK